VEYETNVASTRIIPTNDDLATALWLRALVLCVHPPSCPEDVTQSIADLYELMKVPYRPRIRG
jgi:hypothetical protein